MLTRVHNGLLIAVTTITAIVVPVHVVLGTFSEAAYTRFDWVVTILFIADFLINLRSETAAKARGAMPVVLTTRARVAWFLLDLLAAIPFHLLVPGAALLQLVRLLKLARVGQLMEIGKRRAAEHWTAVRLWFFVYWTVLSVHWLACGWFALHAERSDYIEALYWTVQTLTTVGYGDIPPISGPERIYAMLVMILGIGVYGFLIGNVASILNRIDPAQTHYQENKQRLEVFMKNRNIPQRLQRRIRDFNTYVWEKRLGYDETTVLAGLPPGLHKEVMLFLKKDVIEKVPMFHGASMELISDLALQLRPVVFTPGEYLFKAGDQGQEMYFITRGAVDIVARDGETVYATLTAGDFFGEIALFTHKPRTASARSMSYCDMYALDTPSFERVLERHPAFAAQMAEKTRERQERGS